MPNLITSLKYAIRWRRYIQYPITTMKVIATIGTRVYIRVFKIGLPWELLKGGTPSKMQILNDEFDKWDGICYCDIPMVGVVSVARGSHENSLLQ